MLNMFLSTPPRGGRHLARRGVRGGLFVSIHAPAWGATGRTFDPAIHVHKFLSTPPRGGRQTRPSGCKGGGMFLSTPPRGGRPDPLRPRCRAGSVSIHAPAWGATCHGFESFPEGHCFYPRPRVGGDDALRSYRKEYDEFLSTPPRGGRPTMLVRSPPPLPVSIHAPAWGATGEVVNSLTGDHLFLSTPPRGGRRSFFIRHKGGEYVSIHAPAWGATLLWCAD